MALVYRRLGMAALATVALVLPVLRTDPPETRGASEERGQRLRQMQASLGSVAFRWSALTERDSALRLTRGVVPGASPRIILRGFPAGARSPVAEEGAASLWKELGPVDSTVSVALVIYNDAEYLQRYGSYAGTSIRFEEAGVHCVAVMTGELRPDGTVRTWRESLRRVLAPCVLLAGFGRPGRGIQAWLEATRFGRAASADWLIRPKDFLGGDGGTPWHTTQDFYAGYGGSRILTRASLSSLSRNLIPPYDIGGVALRCLDGDREACAAGVVDTSRAGRSEELFPRDLTVNPWRLGEGEGDFLRPAPVAEYWASDLVRDQGREKFRRFWTSNLPLPDAFQASFGEALGEWTRRWADRVWKGSWQAKYNRSTITLGANIEPSWPLVVAGWSALILVGAGWVANRRQST